MSSSSIRQPPVIPAIHETDLKTGEPNANSDHHGKAFSNPINQVVKA